MTLLYTFSLMMLSPFFFFNDTATTEIYTLSLHDALPIWPEPWTRSFMTTLTSSASGPPATTGTTGSGIPVVTIHTSPDRKSTRLNSSHANISYAVFCLKKKKYIINFQYYKYLFKGVNLIQ